MEKNLNLWWMKKPRPGNFGDILTPEVFTYFKIPFAYGKRNIDFISIGSIATRASDQTVVLGSGIMNRTDILNPNAQWRFVRGPETRNRVIECGGKCPEIYGDPGLLLPLLCDESKKQFDVGIVPHLVDYANIKEKCINDKVINLVNANPLTVAKEISKCRYIISSSLHGIIAAHAYGIPAAWVKFSNNLEGDDIKFIDYFKSVKKETKLSTLDDPVFSTGEVDILPIVKIFEDVKDEYSL